MISYGRMSAATMQLNGAGLGSGRASAVTEACRERTGTMSRAGARALPRPWLGGFRNGSGLGR